MTAFAINWQEQKFLLAYRSYFSVEFLQFHGLIYRSLIFMYRISMSHETLTIIDLAESSGTLEMFMILRNL